MSETIQENQNTPSIADLDAQLLADEAARNEPEVPVEPEVAPEPEPEPEAEPVEAKVDDEDDEFEKRISRLAYEKRTAQKEARELRERIARLETKAPAADEDENTRIERRAAELAAMKVYNDRANSIYQDGIKEFKDFEAKVAGLRDVGLSQQLVEAADEVGDAPKLLYYLGKNLDEAERINGLPAHKMGAALGKIAAKMASTPPPKAQSKAPPPIKPISGMGKAELDDEHMPIDEWMKREDDRWANRGRR